MPTRPESTRAQDDWQSLSRQYWEAWADATRKAFGAKPDEAPQDKTPWHEGLEQWSRFFSADKARDAQSEVVERLLAGARSYFALLQSLAEKGAEGNADPQAWSDALRESFNFPGADRQSAGARAARAGRAGRERFRADDGRPAARVERGADAARNAGVRLPARASGTLPAHGHGVAGLPAGNQPLQRADRARQPACIRGVREQTGRTWRARPADRFGARPVRPVGGCSRGSLCGSRAVR